MNLRTLLLAALVSIAGPALAAHCPADMKKIDEALSKNPTLSSADMDMVKKYRADGEAQHKAGDHGASVETLGKAMKILQIK